MIRFLLILSLSMSCFAHAEKIQFNRDVRPILSDKCFFCHGSDANHRKGDLRLDDKSIAFKPAKSGGTAIVPGKPEQSALIKRINLHADDEDVMPTAKSGKTLTSAEKAVLKQWISEGAEYEGHWAFTKPKAPSIADFGLRIADLVGQAEVAKLTNPIDVFIT